MKFNKSKSCLSFLTIILYIMLLFMLYNCMTKQKIVKDYINQHPNLANNKKQALLNDELIAGMNKKEVEMIFEKDPDYIDYVSDSAGEVEYWYYYEKEYNVIRKTKVCFKNNIVDVIVIKDLNNQALDYENRIFDSKKLKVNYSKQHVKDFWGYPPNITLTMKTNEYTREAWFYYGQNPSLEKKEKRIVIFNNNLVEKWQIKTTDLNIAPVELSFDDLEITGLDDYFKKEIDSPEPQVVNYKIYKDNSFKIYDDSINWENADISLTKNDIFVVSDNKYYVSNYSYNGKLKSKIYLNKKSADTKPFKKVAVTKDSNKFYVINDDMSFDYFETIGNEWLPNGTKVKKDIDFSVDISLYVQNPKIVKTDNRGYIYILDSINGIIHVFSKEGTNIFSFGGFGHDNGLFLEPVAFCFDSKNNVYVLDKSRKIIQKFDKNGDFLYKFGFFGNPDEPFANLITIFTDKNERLFVVDDYYKHIDVFDFKGIFQLRINITGSPINERIFDVNDRFLYSYNPIKKTIERYQIIPE